MARHEEEVVRSMKQKITQVEEKIKLASALGVASGSPQANASPVSPVRVNNGPITSGVVIGPSSSPAKLVLQNWESSGQRRQHGSSTRYHSGGSGVKNTNKWGEHLTGFKKTMYANHANKLQNSTVKARSLGVRASVSGAVESSVDLNALVEEDAGETRNLDRLSFSEYLSQQTGSPEKGLMK